MTEQHEPPHPPADQAADGPDGDARALGLPEFRDAVSRSFVPLLVTAPDPDAFRARLTQANVHGVSFTDIRADAHVVERTPELIGRTPGSFYKISLQLEGRGLLRQGGREVELQPGDLAIYDTEQPYTLTFERRFRTMVIQLPHDRLHIPHEFANRMTAVRLDGHEGLGRVVSPFLATIGTNLAELHGPAGAKLAQNAVDLLETLFATEFDLARYAADPRRAQLQRIRDDIDERLDDPALSPQTIAASAFISVRHLHSLFHDQGQTVASYVRTRRLERCYLDLTDPSSSEVPVATIGARWGFKDAAHFSRVFKGAYGETPSAVRRRALG
ncbi:helix-turn-helix domain-containing protein [Gulosibacter sp. 10]|uniref:AraC-like ligand-binding domain-containing protein n=1 Tax=Gulosibacter sp. 10 TaxID=1255570 RepID=UPI00097F0CE2|nr:helix-turn-helix domain-containing protein [Gulosibacter sp. 10]SJM60154.1 Transcriptional regulator, AraC family [Gulosibacter sp. 10]